MVSLVPIMNHLFNKMQVSAVKRLVVIFLMMVLPAKIVLAQKVLQVDSSTAEHLFGQKEIKILEDKNGTFTLDQVRSADYQKRFTENPGYYPQNYHLKSWYWYKVKVHFDGTVKHKGTLIEFFDQTTDDITAYIPDTTGHYVATKSGAKYNFVDRLYRHKNFEFTIPDRREGEYTYYFRLRSVEQVNVIIVFRTLDYFIHYALTEYMTYGLFYGMILIFCFHNLLMFIAVKRLQYLFYVLYILSVGFYEMSVDGIAFQYIWPTWPSWNEYAYGVALFFLSAFALEFTKELLQVKTRAPGLYKLINAVLIIRTVYFAYCLFFNKGLFIYKFVDSITLAIAFYTGITVWSRGFKPARFFVLGYTFLFLGFMMKLATVLGLNIGVVNRVLGHYSLSLSFVLENGIPLILYRRPGALVA